MRTEVADNPDEQRYEVLVDGHLAGFTRYVLEEPRITLWHTEIEPSFEGRGLGSELAKVALEDVKQQGLELMPLCPFIAKYIRRHPDEYLDVVVEGYRAKVMAG